MSNVLFLSHGGGPLPLVQPSTHLNMINYYKEFSKDYRPSLIVVFSAHSEEKEFTVIGEHNDALFYDYYGFPKESYEYTYNPPVDKVLNDRILKEIRASGIQAIESKKGFDHGVFIPLMLMYPEAKIPVIQISLKIGLDELEHIRLGQSLSALKDENILFIGSGSSFHNFEAILNQSGNERNNIFHDGLVDILTRNISEKERMKLLINWKNIPNSLFSHPRSEHLLPLLICYGIKQTIPVISFDDNILGKRNICVLW